MFRYSVLFLLLAASSVAAGPFFGRFFARPTCVGGSCQRQAHVMPSPADPGDDSGLTEPSGKETTSKVQPSAGEDCQPEIVVQAPADSVPKELNFGVDLDKIEAHKVTLNGRSISCERAIERIGNHVPDDRNKIRLVVIGTPAEREPVARAWENADQSLRDRVSPWFCSADHWSLRDTTTGEMRFQADGHPTIYLLAPDGESLGRMNGFTAAQDVEAIRKAVKKYDADKDADLRKPLIPKKDEAKKTPDPSETNHAKPIAFALGCGVGALLFLRKVRTQ